MTIEADFQDFLVADGQVSQNIELAGKAMQSGSFEKALAYAALTLAWQREREEVVRRTRGGWSA